MKKKFLIWLIVLLVLLSCGFSEKVWDSPAFNSKEESISPSMIVPKLMVRSTNGICYGIADDQGLLFSNDYGRHWEPRNFGLPLKLVYPFDTVEYRDLTAVATDPLHPQRVAVTTAKQLFISNDYGNTWREIPLNRSLFANAYLTAVALSPLDDRMIALGTAYNGLYETINGGGSWSNHSKNLKFLYQGSNYWEEISALTYHVNHPHQLLFSCGYGKGVYSYEPESGKYQSLANLSIPDEHILGISFVEQTGNTINVSKKWYLELLVDRKLRSYSLDPYELVAEHKLAPLPMSSEKKERLKRSAKKYGIYLRSDFTSGTRLTKKIDFLEKHGLDSVVVDFKDDFGNLTYNSQLNLPKQLGAIRNKININNLLAKLKEKDIYVIGRVVVFQDPKLYRYQNKRYALWNKQTNQAWGYFVNETNPTTKQTKLVQREFWVDPYCSDVWDYNIAIAKELQELGVDEIQFDYIRFPTDGNIGTIKYRYHKPGMEKIDALESFLRKARSQLDIPISTDLYGFNCWFKMNSWNGQDLGIFARYVDVISPMFYPSHFSTNFMANVTYLERAKRLYQEGTFRAAWIGNQQAQIRPYVQAFLLGNERKMKLVTYSTYLNNQVEGTLVSPTESGFTLWNNSNNYYMVTESFTQLLAAKQETLPVTGTDETEFTDTVMEETSAEINSNPEITPSQENLVEGELNQL